jgi:hypothetical protein
MSIIEEFWVEMAGAKVFTKLDLNSSFHQIKMAQEDESKTGFKTHHCHFQFKVLPFGLTNAPTTFQCLMNSIFAASRFSQSLGSINSFSNSISVHLFKIR